MMAALRIIKKRIMAYPKYGFPKLSFIRGSIKIHGRRKYISKTPDSAPAPGRRAGEKAAKVSTM